LLAAALHPRTADEAAAALADAAVRKQTIATGGRFTKNAIGGPVAPADCTLSTSAMTRVLEYEPRDLTISVESGLPWSELTALLAANRQMIPLDPPFAGSTVGGVIACNLSGPRRRLYGTARDVVIGMKFALLDGSVAQSGGMVVKNVAGLDMAKLLIGSLGTLAVIGSVNFKLAPMPVASRSFLLAFEDLDAAVRAAAALRKSYLQPAALDLLSPAAAAPLGSRSWTLALQAAGNEAALARYEKEMAALGEGVALEDNDERELWDHIAQMVPRFLERHPEGAVARASCMLGELGPALAGAPAEAIVRAGSGVVYAFFPRAADAATWSRSLKAVVEYSPPALKNQLDLWPSPGQDLEIMQRIKLMFDPHRLLNRGRYYRHF
jgi:glycolate oxidase FAD binding subunit